MGWWSRAMRTKAGSWTFGALDPAHVSGSSPRGIVEPETAYLSGFLRSFWVTDVRKGVTRFYGTVQSHVSLPHLEGGKAEFQVVVTPPDLREVDRGQSGRFVTRDIRIFGPVPYRGGDLEVELGVFSVKGGDLAGPFVELLESVAGAAGVSVVSAALPFVKPVRRGFDLLIGSDGDAILEIGLSTSFAPPETGCFVVVRRHSETLSLSDLHVASDYRLFENGSPLVDSPYAVVAIEASRTRPDWFTLPDVARAYAALRYDAARGTLDAVVESLAAFKKAALGSPDLLLHDAVRLVEKVRSEVDQTLQATRTSGEERALRPLEELQLYA